jgi:hypothetical protein
VELACAPSFMEGARRLEASFIVCVCYCLVEGTLEERGRKLVGTCWG